MDPLAEVNRKLSPFSYAQNNPIGRIDPDGMYDQALVDQWQAENLASAGYNDTQIAGALQRPQSQQPQQGGKKKNNKKSSKNNIYIRNPDGTIARGYDGKPLINSLYLPPIDAGIIFGFMLGEDEFGEEPGESEPLNLQNKTENENDEFSNTQTGGAARAMKYASGWNKSSLIETVNKFAPDSEPITQGSKIIFKNNKTGIQVVYDPGGNYFRIENSNLSGPRRYLDLNGNVPNNKIVNGKQTGRSKTEYQQVTHFNNKD